jgi:hypothetical protein
MVDNLSSDLMAHDTGAGERELAFEDMEIGVADPAGCTKLANTTMSVGDANNQISSSKRIPQDSNLPRRIRMVQWLADSSEASAARNHQSSSFGIWLSKAASITKQSMDSACLLPDRTSSTLLGRVAIQN